MLCCEWCFFSPLFGGRGHCVCLITFLAFCIENWKMFLFNFSSFLSCFNQKTFKDPFILVILCCLHWQCSCWRHQLELFFFFFVIIYQLSCCKLIGTGQKAGPKTPVCTQQSGSFNLWLWRSLMMMQQNQKWPEDFIRHVKCIENRGKSSQYQQKNRSRRSHQKAQRAFGSFEVPNDEIRDGSRLSAWSSWNQEACSLVSTASLWHSHLYIKRCLFCTVWHAPTIRMRSKGFAVRLVECLQAQPVFFVLVMFFLWELKDWKKKTCKMTLTGNKASCSWLPGNERKYSKRFWNSCLHYPLIYSLLSVSFNQL